MEIAHSTAKQKVIIKMEHKSHCSSTFKLYDNFNNSVVFARVLLSMKCACTLLHQLEYFLYDLFVNITWRTTSKLFKKSKSTKWKECANVKRVNLKRGMKWNLCVIGLRAIYPRRCCWKKNANSYNLQPQCRISS